MTSLLRNSVLAGLTVGAVALTGCGEDTVVYADGAGGTTGGETGESLPEGNASSLEVVGATPLASQPANFVDNANFFAQACNQAGTGIELGNQMGSLQLTNCEGETVDLHEYCGRRKAVLLVAAAGWCGACRSSMPEMVGIQEEGRRTGLDAFVVWGEKDDSSPADQAFCEQVAAQYGLDPARTFFDPGFSATQGRLNPVAPGENSYGLPWHVVLDPFDMTYYWSSSDPQGVSEAQAIEDLLQ